MIRNINLKISDEVEAQAIAERKAENEIWLSQMRRLPDPDY